MLLTCVAVAPTKRLCMAVMALPPSPTHLKRMGDTCRAGGSVDRLHRPAFCRVSSDMYTGLVPRLSCSPFEDAFPRFVGVRLDALQHLRSIGPAGVNADDFPRIRSAAHYALPILHLPRHSGVHGLFGEGDVVDREVNHQLVIALVVEQVVDVVEGGDVPPAGFHHDVHPALLSLLAQQDAHHFREGAVALEDARLLPGVLRHVGQAVQLAEILVGDGGDHVVQLAEEAVVPIRELSLVSAEGSPEGVSQGRLEPRLVHRGCLADAVDPCDEDDPGLFTRWSVRGHLLGGPPIPVLQHAMEKRTKRFVAGTADELREGHG
mmetsp:Transcript_5214/g.9922  ORF Transcript_5214/g.9922 Transcript_5214/m.9922 type:complete len:320 (+) Transcript_5214:199-1158(+)